MVSTSEARELLDNENAAQRAIGLFRIFDRQLGGADGGSISMEIEVIRSEQVPILVPLIAKLAREDDNLFVRVAALDRLKTIIWERTVVDDPSLRVFVDQAIDAIISCLGNTEQVMVPILFSTTGNPAGVVFGRDNPPFTLGEAARYTLEQCGEIALEKLAEHAVSDKQGVTGARDVFNRLINSASTENAARFINRDEFSTLARDRILSMIETCRFVFGGTGSSYDDLTSFRDFLERDLVTMPKDDFHKFNLRLNWIERDIKHIEKILEAQLGRDSADSLLGEVRSMLSAIERKREDARQAYERLAPPGGWKGRGPSPRTKRTA